MLLRQHHNLSETTTPLDFCDFPDPVPQPHELLILVTACGVCHTELDEIEGRLPPPRLPVIPGHQVVGRVISAPYGSSFSLGDRVGLAWIYASCGQCSYCLSGMENLCPQFLATGKDRHGGYAQFVVANPQFAFPIPPAIPDAQAAPLLCAGAIGFRSLRLANLHDGLCLGLAGFGASAHLVARLAHHLYPHSPIFVFSRSEPERQFALQLGATWAGAFSDTPPAQCSAIIDTTPAWLPVLQGLRHLAPGGRLVINAIRKEIHDQALLSSLDYPSHLWMEKEIKSVANVTRADVREFLALAAQIPILPEYQVFDLSEANRALLELKNRQIHGAKVLLV